MPHPPPLSASRSLPLARPRSSGGPITLARLRLRRSAILYWLGVGTLALIVGTGMVAALRHRAGAAGGRRPTATVIVARDSLRPGEPIAGHLATARRPVEELPPGTLRAMPAPGRLATAYIAAGEIVIDKRLSGRSGDGPAALLAPGTRGITIDLGEGSEPPLRVGDEVDVVTAPSSSPGDVSGSADEAQTVASGATVIHVSDQAVTVAVPTRRVDAVAAAIAGSSVTVVLSSPSEP